MKPCEATEVSGIVGDAQSNNHLKWLVLIAMYIFSISF